VCDERLTDLFSPKESRQRGDTIALYSYLMGECTEDGPSVLEAHCGRTRENGHRLEHEEF